MALQHYEDEIRADTIELLADAEACVREMEDFARGRCPYCDSRDGMAVSDAYEVDRWIAKHPVTEYETFPYYWFNAEDRLLCSPCGVCNFHGYIPAGYTRLSFQQVEEWLERRNAGQ